MHLPRALHLAVSASKAKNGSAPRFASDVEMEIASWKSKYPVSERDETLAHWSLNFSIHKAPQD